MAVKSLKSNFIYNLLLTFLNIVIPLITLPYLSVILGVDNIGKVNLATSVTTWLVLLASLGIPTYGIREIAKARDDKKKLSIVFWELNALKAIITVIILLIYVIVIFNQPKFYSEVSLYLIFAISIIANLFSTDWFFQGIEEYKYITTRGFIIKVITLVFIFVGVKNQDDYMIYAGITVILMLANNLVNIVYCRKFIDFKFQLRELRIFSHLKSLKYFWISGIIFSIYTQLDVLILGLNASDKAVAFYTRSKQVQMIALSFSTALSQVLIPRASYLFNHDIDRFKEIVGKSVNYILLISIPMTLGVMILSKEIMWILGGDNFIAGALCLTIIGSTIIIYSLGTLLYSQVLLPMGHDNKSLKIHAISAGVSIVFNFMLIPKFAEIGAAIAFLLAQSVGNVYGILLSKRLVSIRIVSKSSLKYGVAGAAMLLAIYLIKLAVADKLIVICSSLALGSIVFFAVLFVSREEIVMASLTKISNKILKNNKVKKVM
ncbi:flippase [Paenibacillus sedimenti]|uniref:Flippase n=1 Tax=Paenibacillus sedimenti TaxID=2770274 RepID=A0A926KL04_9BACL|nr:flippase [Paenibacillus sedimenti]MBD0379742.1 flippase [Paenibacillus sedimenti]